MFFLFLILLLVPSATVFAMDNQDQQLQDERRNRVQGPLFPKPTRAELDNALTAMEVFVAQNRQAFQWPPIPAQSQVVQQEWNAARQQTTKEDYKHQ